MSLLSNLNKLEQSVNAVTLATPAVAASHLAYAHTREDMEFLQLWFEFATMRAQLMKALEGK
jgi:hypothetical protein